MNYTPTQEQHLIETLIVEYLTKFKNVYSKTLYKALRIKIKFGLSLNKFRDILYQMYLRGVITKDGDVLPYWNIN